MLSEVFVSVPHCVSHHPAATTRQILRFSQGFGWRIHSFGVIGPQNHWRWRWCVPLILQRTLTPWHSATS